MSIEADLYDAALDLLETRYPRGQGGAAAMRTAAGRILTSISPDTRNDALSLCIKVGAYLEAHKLNEVVTHSLCIYREDEKSDVKILSPCGICQERLMHWGGEVLAAVTNSQNMLVFKPLRELQPYHWSAVEGTELGLGG